jgi:hypothetical protein
LRKIFLVVKRSSKGMNNMVLLQEAAATGDSSATERDRKRTRAEKLSLQLCPQRFTITV